MSISRESTQAWISTGNLFSLQRDHDQAMRCFKRATQIDPGCVYAWTLCGYEAIEMEEYERAIAFYRTAIRTDGRHYNAWYVFIFHPFLWPAFPFLYARLSSVAMLMIGTVWEWFMRKLENCVMRNIIIVEQRTLIHLMQFC